MNNFGLVGKDISYSFSKNYFTEKFKKEKLEGYFYHLFDLVEINEIDQLFLDKNLKGFNVTIPYKQQIIPYLDELSVDAEKIGAVNCVKIEGGKKIGYNTDAYGFEMSILPFLEDNHKKALVLGDGGAAQAVKFVLDKLGLDVTSVTRKGELVYKNLSQGILEEHFVIINTTPVGTFPAIESAPEIPYEYLSSKHLLYDLIYNPAKTRFLELAEKKGAKIKNGYEMLVLQAEKSWEIWNQTL